MYAAYLDELGGPEVIRHGELPDPVPGPTDVLVDVLATTVNPVDTFVRSGKWRTPLSFPFVVSRDLVGVVASAGPGAPGFSPGEWVWANSLGHAGRQGAAAQRAVVPAERLYHLPPSVDPTDAVTVAHPAATAYLGLFTHGRVRAGETVLVAGAGGNVGSAMVTMAVDAGARVITTSSARDTGYCRSIGASETFDYADPRLPELLRAVCPRGIDVWLDNAGRNDLSTAVGLLAFRGRIVLLAGLDTRPVLPAGSLYLKDGTVTGFTISRANVAELAEAASVINRLLAAGTLRPRAKDTVPLSAMAEAHRRLEQGLLHGRRLVVDTGRFDDERKRPAMSTSIVDTRPLFELSAEIEVDASPAEIYAVVSDLKRSAEWSPECRGGQWISGEPSQVGSVFRGENLRADDVVGWAPLVRGTWHTESRVIAADPGRTFRWMMLSYAREDQESIWGFDIRPSATGGVLTHHFRMGKATVGIHKIVAELSEPDRRRFVADWTAKLEQDLADTLKRLKDVIEHQR
nr:zinc-binding dehydrogenase [Kibdelosporangium sp. MJ126-NF4]CEL18574.1 Bifunctional protein: zinc-containing alcohol dehydrogenase; quinone oxidoreductase (NADPH:quinone reductase); Similar to arginate lyase [Kibdelosporangium sp. MJ126-NF4]CTQ98058.1 Bifunctional protein: zinc-containing alcohol dehydrogenase; quinone oxidoreductase (NADPH:quinone reductase) (EC 1.1.1.-); Similar to arginate lyase [Kibdelosporangium sp. MJ126-NF4]